MLRRTPNLLTAARQFRPQQQQTARAFFRRYATSFIVSGTVAAATTTTIAFCWGGGPGGQTHVALPLYPPELTPNDEQTLPMMSLDDVKRGVNGGRSGRVLVTYNGFVYDVTEFADAHPGGRGLLLTANGLDLDHFFTNYKVHTKTSKALDFLEGMKVGRLSEADAAMAKALTTPDAHVASRFRVLGDSRLRLLCVVALTPLMLMLRTLVRLVGFVIPPLGHTLAAIVPVAVPGYGDARPLLQSASAHKKKKIAVVGGGIAGCSCAYALARSGYDVTLFEARDTVSGNAHTFDWAISSDNDIFKTCVAVTAWPKKLFHGYAALLKQLDVATVPIPLTWLLNSKIAGHEGVLRPSEPGTPEGTLREHFKKDFDRFESALGLIDWVNKAYSLAWLRSSSSDQKESIYDIQAGLGWFNPFTLVPLRTVARCFGVSDAWWDIVYAPYYSPTYLTDHLDGIVAASGTIVEKIIPLFPRVGENINAENQMVTCDTWAEGGAGIREVFGKLTKDCTVKTATRVTDVHRERSSSTDQLMVTDDAGGCETFDRVVFACPANAISNIVKDTHSWWEKAIFASPEYADDYHPTTGHMHAVMHNDASVIPAEFRDDFLRNTNNYVEVTKHSRTGEINIENTYNFGVSTPKLRDLPNRPPLLITHSLGEGKTIDPSKVVGDGSHARAHPLYSGWNMITMLTLRLAQGRHGGMYYCCNYTTPGNGHDLSMNSGFLTARAIGAAYPIEDSAAAEADCDRLGFLMGL